MVAEDDCVAAHFIVRGRHTGDFLGFPATGGEFAFSGIANYRITNGQLAEAWYGEDTLGWFQQLGLLPTRSPRVRRSTRAATSFIPARSTERSSSLIDPAAGRFDWCERKHEQPSSCRWRDAARQNCGSALAGALLSDMWGGYAGLFPARVRSYAQGLCLSASLTSLAVRWYLRRTRREVSTTTTSALSTSYSVCFEKATVLPRGRWGCAVWN